MWEKVPTKEEVAHDHALTDIAHQGFGQAYYVNVLEQLLFYFTKYLTSYHPTTGSSLMCYVQNSYKIQP